MPPEFGRKWGTECLNTRFSLPTLLRAGYSVKLKKKGTIKVETPNVIDSDAHGSMTHP